MAVVWICSGDKRWSGDKNGRRRTLLVDRHPCDRSFRVVAAQRATIEERPHREGLMFGRRRQDSTQSRVISLETSLSS